MALALAASGGYCFSLKAELKLGADASKEVAKEMPPSTNQQWQKDIQALGKRFLPFLKRKEIPYHFQVIQAKEEINAFALPGGYVYFTERMWRIMTPDERAGIMAHEITHCDHRHGVDMMLKSQQRFLWTLPLVIATGGAAMEAAMWGNVIISQRYSRKLERDADESGIKLLAAAGFKPAGMVTSMKKLLNIEADQNRYEVSAIFADHPDTLKRVEYLTQEAESMGAKEADLELKAVDDPSRLGNIIAKTKEVNLVSARASTPLDYGRKVAIKKMLWDDNAQMLAPKTIAIATVLTPGRFPILVLPPRDDYSYSDIMPGDGVYPASDADLAPPPTPAPKTPPENERPTAG